jgi:hypothetical protein
MTLNIVTGVRVYQEVINTPNGNYQMVELFMKYTL